ncbi:MAG: tannase/feruloyl esterase family alpha/beta hydrolase [Rhodoferax sp.]|uniref:tannase/feruloyl esterase family alpha/beta hydrolase n=1 Tax=Rhodoferax sp. TaxID=50421 RepID=UPI002717A8F2|nr:tannase/feruloyl esterase family alpha/beta hydrolase [Rhodoferax sp.]MDO8450540.1 tannase/feruloyl esterase family alpha/beta hydrolase [Rhodoferax sp.]
MIHLRHTTMTGAVTVLLAACTTSSNHVDKNVPPAPVECAQIATKFIATGTRITATESVPAGLTVAGMAQPYPMPAHCKVTGKMNERTGVDGKPYAIGFDMRLPVNWSGRFLFQANGGADGVVQPAFGNVVSGGAATNALMQGFAVLSSDAGHTAESGPAVGLVGGNLFGMDPQARLDYGYQANGALAPMAKKLITTHYGQAPKTSYMMGCSNGGRHAMVAASRYADQFDGVIAGNPGFNLPKAAVQHAWDIQAFSAVNPDIKAAFPPADMKLLADKVLDTCDALDGVADAMVNNLAACQKVFDIKALQCAGDKTAQCLSQPQVTALQKVFAGPSNSKGEPLYSDWPWDAGVGASQIGFGSWRAWKLQGPIAGLPIIGALGAGSVAYTFSTPPKPVAGNPPALIKYLLDYNFDTDAATIFAASGIFKESSVQFMTPPNATDLSAFKTHGGKMIVYHGTSDPVFSFNDTRNWYEALDKNHAGNAASFARLFPVPGMNHCQGGPATEQFDMLSTLVNWVEKGRAPEQVIATARTGINPDVPADWISKGLPRSRPLCPYPKQARYRGVGDINEAANFSCQ